MAYEPILMSQIASCADWLAQIDARSIHRASEDFGFAERGIFRSRKRCLGWYWTDWNQVLRQDASDLRPHRQDPGFASSWASWYHTDSHVGKSGSFDILVLANIIQRGMEHVTSNGTRISYETTEQSIFTFFRSRTLFVVEHRNNFFHLQSMSKG